MKSFVAAARCYCACVLLILPGALLSVATGQGQTVGTQGSETGAGSVDGILPQSVQKPSFADLKRAGSLASRFRLPGRTPGQNEAAGPDLEKFHRDVQPILNQRCTGCHGGDVQEGNVRIDTLDPDLIHGPDLQWWLELLAVLIKEEMPPADEVKLPDEDRRKVVDWLSSEIQVASRFRRAEGGHSSFRRMTRYEFNYAVQDLLGLPFEFARDLPPDPISEDGLENSSEMLHMSGIEFEAYREAGRQALQRATVRGDHPDILYWSISMEAAAAREWARRDEERNRIRRDFQSDPEELEQQLGRLAARFRPRPGMAHFRQLKSGKVVRTSWRYHGAKYAWHPAGTHGVIPNVSDHVAVLPPGQQLIIELGDQIPDEGLLRVRVRASRTSEDHQYLPELHLEFGWQASNDSHASIRISRQNHVIDAIPGQPQFYQWDIPLSEVSPRNSVRHISKLGDLPSPSEYLKLVNSSVSRGEVQIDFVEVAAPVYDQWPPASHLRIFQEFGTGEDETASARSILNGFMSRAWRREVTLSEINQKLELFSGIRPQCDSFEDAIIEVLATVLASPKFLYLVRSQPEEPSSARRLTNSELATRLAIFLWCSTPDEELLRLAASGELRDRDVLVAQVQRMLADIRSRRFSEQFTRQWLGMQLLEFLQVDRKVYPQFDSALKEAMKEEPISFFHEILQNNHSVLDFIHADYSIVNERLARHYGVSGVRGSHFRRVQLEPQQRRGGLLTQAGLLAMNSDGNDSHPLKRGIWLLERLLNDPPPPPPPAVPEIDLADPEIAKLTLKERIENHRNQAACLSCHARIDPWGIAFENFDAVGSWRTEIDGKPVDASSLLFNGQPLEGIDGLKRFLLENRQDQFVSALVHKMVMYALGRPLTFGDRSGIDQMTAELRQQGDGLATMVILIVTSELFHAR